MSVLINADTSDGLVLTSDTSGEIKLQSAGADIATVDSTGITMAAGKTIPAASLTGTLPAIDGSSLTNLPAPAALSTASGSAPSYSARAWVNFNGTGTVAIRESGNVSSITDNGTGDYTVNFTTAMTDANYSTTGTSGGVNTGYILGVYSSADILIYNSCFFQREEWISL
jgi:hypothetical protein